MLGGYAGSQAESVLENYCSYRLKSHTGTIVRISPACGQALCLQ